MEKYGFDRDGLVVATAVNAYLKNLMPAARAEVLKKLIRQDGVETVVDGPALIKLIENARASAAISAENWKPGEGDYQKALTLIREQLPAADGKRYAHDERFLRFVEDLAEEYI